MDRFPIGYVAAAILVWFIFFHKPSILSEPSNNQTSTTIMETTTMTDTKEPLQHNWQPIAAFFAGLLVIAIIFLYWFDKKLKKEETIKGRRKKK